VQSYSNIKLYEPNKLYDPNKKDDPDVSDMDKIEEELFHEAKLFFEAAKKRMADLYPKIKLIYPISNKCGLLLVQELEANVTRLI